MDPGSSATVNRRMCTTSVRILTYGDFDEPRQRVRQLHLPRRAAERAEQAQAGHDDGEALRATGRDVEAVQAGSPRTPAMNGAVQTGAANARHQMTASGQFGQRRHSMLSGRGMRVYAASPQHTTSPASVSAHDRYSLALIAM